MDQNTTTRLSYTKLKKVGEGTYASVFLAKNVHTGLKVAIKKIKIQTGAGGGKDGLDPTALREVGFLREMNHKNVIGLIDIFSSGTAAGGSPSLNLVLEFLPSNMESLIHDRSLLFTPSDVKSYMAQLLSALEYIHARGCIHRDLKPNNLLIAPDSSMKIADFGLARDIPLPGEGKMTNQVITRWYRPPELLLGARFYSSKVDLWSTGAIFAELMLRTPYMPGESDAEQLEVIFKARGTPTDQEWTGWKSLPGFASAGQGVTKTVYPKPSHAQLFTAAPKGALLLLDALLEYDPYKRPSATKSLRSLYFASAPRPSKLEELPKKQSTSEEEMGKGLMSDSKEKDAQRERAQMPEQQATSATKRPAASNGSGTAAPAKRPAISQEVIAQRKAMARKMAFG